MDIKKLPPIYDRNNLQKNEENNAKTLKIAKRYITASFAFLNKVKDNSSRAALLKAKSRIKEATKLEESTARIMGTDPTKINKVSNILLDTKGLDYHQRNLPKEKSVKQLSKGKITLTKITRKTTKPGRINYLNFDNSIKFEQFLHRYNLGNLFYSPKMK